MARISELHYSNIYAFFSGVPEFVEVALPKGTDPSDFTVSFYSQSGDLILEVALTEPGVQVFCDRDATEDVYVIQSCDFPFQISDPDIPFFEDYNAEGIALTNTANGEVINFYDIGCGSSPIEARTGAAEGAQSTNLPTPTKPIFANYSLQFNQPNPDQLVYGPLTLGNSGVICFTTGTLIDTPHGPRPVEDLVAGDLVTTLDNGSQPLAWVGARTVVAQGDLAPVVVTRGVLGALRDTAVSPQHRMLVRVWQAEMLFGEAEVLVPAIGLVNGETVYRRTGGEVRYHHLLFDTHQIVRADGAWSESFHPGPVGVSTLARATREEVLRLFPELRCNPDAYGPAARPGLRVREAAVLAENVAKLRAVPI
ncbi:Hint domain-containing protein [Tropicimonas sp. S265A]|uniref:Hint domain-containing protein n=1 Tax=Tropicimonas sp. S265A TaxID=3415134 RepID=UPI003C7D0F38